VILCTGAAGRLGLPSSGYLFGTYENPTNAGEGHVMAYHAGAELTNLECYQINPLIKDYNGPACAYVTGPFGGYTANAHGERFIECDYWSGQMMLEFFNELESGKGPVFLKLDHLADETISEIEHILHTNERPSRGRFHQARGTDYRRSMIEMHISEIGFCSGHSASGIVNERQRPQSGPVCRGRLRSVPHASCSAPSSAASCARAALLPNLAGAHDAETQAPSRAHPRALAPGADAARSNTRRAASSTTTCSRPRSRASS
jgi:succinate dehydrogenase/fumarate reductase flavoprotein subunit